MIGKPQERLHLSGTGPCPWEFEEAVQVTVNMSPECDPDELQMLDYVVRATSTRCDLGGHAIGWTATLQLVFDGRREGSVE